jgi:DNA-binding NtrC family response regulator
MAKRGLVRRVPALPAGDVISIETIEIIGVIVGQPERYLVQNAHNTIRPLAEVEKDAIEEAIVFCHGDRDLAAARLRINRRTIDRKLLIYERRRKAEADRLRKSRNSPPALSGIPE